ncbi:MAG: DUF4149 domain-containing protein [Deltaproteobacteria bacterium]|nr:DUF4149 domain-containing protein [Deltaproteobacteria bacterium]
MRAAGMLLYNLVLCLWIGGMVLFTFVVTPLLFRHYDRNVAGDIVGTLIPAYFRYNLLLALLGAALLLAFWWAWSPLPRRLALVLLLGAALVEGYVSFRLHPQIAAVKKTVASFESDPGSPARKRFRTLHALSAALNLAVLADGVALLVLRPLLPK